jgi:hypothetical protein
MSKRKIQTLWGLGLAGLMLVVPLAARAESETLLYARYLDERAASFGLDKIADAQEEGALTVKAGAYLLKSGKLKVERFKPNASVTATALIDGLIGVLSRSPGKLVACPDDDNEPMALRSCPEQKDAFMTLAAMGVPKPTVMRIRNSFPWWYSGYTADEAAIILVVPADQVGGLISRLRRTKVMDIIGYTVSAERIQMMQETLQPPRPQLADR